MATISNVALSIQKGSGGSRRAVSVTFKECFTGCESLAGSTFVERVYLRGDDPIWDDNLILLSQTCVKATGKCVDRKIAGSVSRSTLDEDGDTVIVIFGIPILKIADMDEIYAYVELTPFAPSGAQATSNIVHGQWGAAGND